MRNLLGTFCLIACLPTLVLAGDAEDCAIIPMGNWNGVYFYGTTTCEGEDCEPSGALGWGVRTQPCHPANEPLGCQGSNGDCSCGCVAKMAPTTTTEAGLDELRQLATKMAASKSQPEKGKAATRLLSALKNFKPGQPVDESLQTAIDTIVTRKLLVEYNGQKYFITASTLKKQLNLSEFDRFSIGENSDAFKTLTGTNAAELHKVMNVQHLLTGVIAVPYESKTLYFRLKSIRVGGKAGGVGPHLRIGQQVTIPASFPSTSMLNAKFVSKERGGYAHVIAVTLPNEKEARKFIVTTNQLLDAN